jgi:HAD superfamily hydrolase (TIGR01509 family)
VTRGILFDLDGVLADTERLHWTAYRALLGEYGLDIPLEEYRHRFIAQGGGPEWACAHYRLPITADELRERKAPRYRALLEADLRERPGARAALRRLRADGYRLAVATNSLRDEVQFVLGRLGMHGLLDAVVAREDYVRAKPAPDAYLTAAARLGLEPAACGVIEDTARGVRAAVAAGIPVIAVPHDLTFDNDFTGCVRRLPDLDALTRAVLGAL